MSLVKWNNTRKYPVYNTLFDQLFTDMDRVMGSNAQHTIPAVNIAKSSEGYELALAVPGLTKEDLVINVKDNTLGISTVIKEEKKEDNTDWKRREFNFESFSREFTLPENANVDDLKASYEAGILQIHIPVKAPVDTTRSISID